MSSGQKGARPLYYRLDHKRVKLFFDAIGGDEGAKDMLIASLKKRAVKLKSELNISSIEEFTDAVIKQFKESLNDDVKGHILMNYFSRFHPNVVDIKGEKPPRSIILLGAPGIGKSERVYQCGRLITDVLNLLLKDDEPVLLYETLTLDNYSKILNEPDKYFVIGDIRLVYYTDPSEIRGIPLRVRAGEQFMVVDTPSMYSMIMSRVAGIMFLDELTNADPMTLNASYQILLDHMVGFTKLHNDVIVVGAGNTTDYSITANILPKPLLTRADVKMVKTPKVKEWYRHMLKTYGNKWDFRVYNYLEMKANINRSDPPIGVDGLIVDPDYFRKTMYNQEPYNCPRSWTEFALKIYMLNNMFNVDVIEEIIKYRKMKASQTNVEVEQVKLKLKPDEIENIEHVLKSIIGEGAYQEYMNFASGILDIWEIIKEIVNYGKAINDTPIMEKVLKKLDDYSKVLMFTIKVAEYIAKDKLESTNSKALLINLFLVLLELYEMRRIPDVKNAMVLLKEYIEYSGDKELKVNYNTLLEKIKNKSKDVENIAKVSEEQMRNIMKLGEEIGLG